MKAADFIITDTPVGIRLSKPGHWGNIPFDTIEDAEAEAQRLMPGSLVVLAGYRKGNRG